MDRSWIIRGRARLGSEAGREFGEPDPDTITGGHIDGEFVVAAAQVLHERVAGRHQTEGADRRHAAHRLQSGLEASVVGLDTVVRVLINYVPSGGDELVDHARIDRGP